MILLLTPILTVFADELPYQQPTYAPYLPNVKPYIPKGVQIEEQKPKEEQKKETQTDYANIIKATALFTPAIWNVFGDIVPSVIGVKYVEKNQYVLLRETSKKVKVVFKYSPDYIANWMVPRRPKIESFGWKIGNKRIGKYLYSFIKNRLTSFVQSSKTDLVEKSYTHPEYEATEYYAKKQKYTPGNMDVWKMSSKEVTKTLKETFFLTNKTSTSAAVPKLTGYLGLGFSTAITFFNYTYGEKKAFGWKSEEFLAALPIDFFTGGVVGGVSAYLSVPLVAQIASYYGFVFPAAIGALAAIVIALVISGLILEIPIVKRITDRTHAILTAGIKKTHKTLKDRMIKVSDFIKRVHSKTNVGIGSVTQWFTNKLGK